MDNTKFTIKLERKHIFFALTALVVFGGIIRFLAAYKEIHYFDIPYYYDWANSAFKDGLFKVYNTLADEFHAVDYPPLFLFPLYITGAILQIPDATAFENYLMLALKGWQVIFDIAIIVALYFALKRYNKVLALGASTMWAINPAIIFSSSYWGQTDSIMIFFLLLVFVAIDSEKPVLATVLYALACLTKFQCAYFAPVLLLFLFFGKFPVHQIITAISAAAFTVFTVFLPFVANSGITLPFKIYFGGFGKWPYASLYSFNFFGMLNLNYVEDSFKILPFLSASTLGSIMTVLAVVLTIFIYSTAKGEKKCPFILSFIIMNTVFMFASRMHERYQIPVLIFLLIACVKHKSIKLFAAYIMTTVMVFLNTALVYEHIVYNDSQPVAWMQNTDTLVVVFSAINLLVYFITLYLALDTIYSITPRIKNLLKNNIEESETENGN